MESGSGLFFLKLATSTQFLSFFLKEKSLLVTHVEGVVQYNTSKHIIRRLRG